MQQIMIYLLINFKKQRLPLGLQKSNSKGKILTWLNLKTQKSMHLPSKKQQSKDNGDNYQTDNIQRRLTNNLSVVFTNTSTILNTPNSSKKSNL